MNRVEIHRWYLWQIWWLVRDGKGEGERGVKDDAGLWSGGGILMPSLTQATRECRLGMNEVLSSCLDIIYLTCLWEIYMVILSRQLYPWIWTLRCSCKLHWKSAWERLIAPRKKDGVGKECLVQNSEHQQYLKDKERKRLQRWLINSSQKCKKKKNTKFLENKNSCYLHQMTRRVPMAKSWNMSIGLNQKKVLGAFNESSFSGMLT